MNRLIPADEHLLIARAQRGDMQAFETLVGRYEQYVYNLALRVVRDPGEAEDLAQGVFIRVWRGLPRFRLQAKFSTWLYRITANLCYNHLPNLRQDLEALEVDDQIVDLPEELQEVESAILSAEMRSTLHKAIENLPESYRLLISLRHLQELSYAEIAEVTGMPLGTVKTGIFRARQLLRQAVDKYEESYEYENKRPAYRCCLE